jgi:hypothetical protein
MIVHRCTVSFHSGTFVDLLSAHEGFRRWQMLTTFQNPALSLGDLVRCVPLPCEIQLGLAFRV